MINFQSLLVLGELKQSWLNHNIFRNIKVDKAAKHKKGTRKHTQSRGFRGGVFATIEWEKISS